MFTFWEPIFYIACLALVLCLYFVSCIFCLAFVIFEHALYSCSAISKCMFKNNNKGKRIMHMTYGHVLSLLLTLLKDISLGSKEPDHSHSLYSLLGNGVFRTLFYCFYY